MRRRFLASRRRPRVPTHWVGGIMTPVVLSGANANDQTFSRLLVSPNDYEQNVNIEADSVTLAAMRISMSVMYTVDATRFRLGFSLGIVACDNGMPFGAENAVAGTEPMYRSWHFGYGADNNIARADWLWWQYFVVSGVTWSPTLSPHFEIDLTTRDTFVKAKRRLKDKDIRLVLCVPPLIANESIQVDGAHRSLLRGAI